MAYIGFTIITPWHALRQDFQNLPAITQSWNKKQYLPTGED